MTLPMTLPLEQELNKEELIEFAKGVNLRSEDIVYITTIIYVLNQNLHSDVCWEISKMKNLSNFTNAQDYIPRYKGRDIRPLLLAINGVFPDNKNKEVKNKDQEILMRAGNCNSKDCINPTHYLYGDRLDVSIARWQRTGIEINKEIYYEIISLRKESPKEYTINNLSHMFNFSKNTIRTICDNGTKASN